MKTEQQKARRKAKGQEVRDAVTEMYLEDGNGHDVKEIAARMGRSEGWVREYVDVSPDIVLRADSRPSYSTSYRGFETGYHKVNTYFPQRSHLRQMILDARKGMVTESSDQVPQDSEAPAR